MHQDISAMGDMSVVSFGISPRVLFSVHLRLELCYPLSPRFEVQ